MHTHICIYIYIYIYGQSRFLNCGSFSEIKNCKNACVHNVSALLCSKTLLYTTFRLFFCSKMLLYTTFGCLFAPKCFCTQRFGWASVPKVSATLHGNAPRQCRTSATLHGNAFLLTRKPSTGPDRTQWPKRQPNAPKGDAKDWEKESAAPWKIKRRSAQMEEWSLKKWIGRPRTIGKQSARVPNVQHDKNHEVPNTGKHNTGERGRRSDTEHFERHAAWERFRKSATLHGSNCGEPNACVHNVFGKFQGPKPYVHKVSVTFPSRC